ncbi:MAG: bifunctional 4-hydroxy-2-oxoglutarate aldolase/2-dehydro-3-deoxy-phosphogluconate aldolase [Clostridia bacterium]|nr:bifunctional 4-hydroxy-2-oxoglutarate aldolase/2-dehydro-3-deoxy-phosphogluconate aldolase [Clostridia bacterium]
MRSDVIKQIEQNKIIAIMRGIETDDAVRVAEALYKGGIKLVEVTFNQSDKNSFIQTANAIKAIKTAMEGKMCVGAGTVITVEQLQLARDAGAEYIISPDTDEDIIKKTVEMGLVSIPGAYTATEAKKAYNAGADFVKLFPCASVSYLKALKAPLSHIKYLAVGGVDLSNAKEYMQAGASGIGVGSLLINKDWINAGKFDKITETATALANQL